MPGETENRFSLTRTALRTRERVRSKFLPVLLWLAALAFWQSVAQAGPQILAQPLNQSVPAGATISLSVSAAGSGPLSYEWKRVNSSLIEAGRIQGIWTANLTISNAQPGDIGLYRVVVNDATGSVSSHQALVAVGRRSVMAWGDNGLGQATVASDLTNVVFNAVFWEGNLSLRENGVPVSWGRLYYGSSPMPGGLTNIVGLAPGGYHALALSAAGTVTSWGDDTYGQTTSPLDLTNAVAISAGLFHSMALRSDGTVSVWGGTDYGVTNVPSGLSNVLAIASGWDYCLALKDNGSVAAWGANYSGQTNIPPGVTNIIAIASGNAHALALRGDGTVAAWGHNNYGQTTVPADLSNVVAIAAGVYHSAAIRNDGSLVVWGKDSLGQPLSPPACAVNVLALADSGDHCVALVGDRPPCISGQPKSATIFRGGTVLFQGTVTGSEPLFFQWQLDGTNIAGATDLTLTLTNVQMSQAGDYTLSPSNWVGVAQSAPAVLDLVQIAAWGGGAGNRNNVPATATNVVQISEGDIHSLALTSDHQIISWGNTSDSGSTLIPAGLTNPVAIEGGSTYTLALQGNGTVIGWAAPPTIPSSVTNAVAIAAGGSHCVALRSNQTVVAWGNNTYGQVSVPSGLTNVVQVAAGRVHSLALKRDGTVAAWGDNSLQQRDIPAGLSNIVAICAGRDHNLALKNDGTVVAWGRNSGGQTVVPANLNDVVAIAAGSEHSLALRADGTVIAWGTNNLQQTTIPAGLSRAVAIAAGGSHSLALVGTGRPQLAVQPICQSVIAGSPLALACFAAGDPPLSYQWQFQGTNIANATNAMLRWDNIPITAAGEYRCIVTNADGTATSAIAVVSIAREPLRFDVSRAQLGFTNGALHLRLTGLAGQGPAYILASSNLLNWELVCSNPPHAGPLEFLDLSSTNQATRFYRALEGY